MLLYSHPLSANAHKVLLLAGFANIPVEEAMIDVPGGEQRRPPFLAVSALGQIPVLIDGDLTLRDSQAILIYLATKHAPAWFPADAAAQGRIAQWLIFAALEQQNGINLARLSNRLGLPCDLPAARAQGAKSMAFLDARLAARDWLELDRPTIADCACAPFAGRSGEGDVPLADYPAVARWLDRLRALPGFHPMEGLA